MCRTVPTAEDYPTSSVSGAEMRDLGLEQALGPCRCLLSLSLSSLLTPFSRESHLYGPRLAWQSRAADGLCHPWQVVLTCLCLSVLTCKMGKKLDLTLDVLEDRVS